jgi:hypothetical protein
MSERKQHYMKFVNCASLALFRRTHEGQPSTPEEASSQRPEQIDQLYPGSAGCQPAFGGSLPPKLFSARLHIVGCCADDGSDLTINFCASDGTALKI